MADINFYEGPYYLLSNFSAHQVVFEGETWMTSEHAYQASKYQNKEMREKVKNAPSAYLSREYGQAKEGKIENWDEMKVEVMKNIMREKALQHKDVMDALLSTGESVIIKNHPEDYYWGTGLNGTGKNVMGIIWMELREEFQIIQR